MNDFEPHESHLKAQQEWVQKLVSKQVLLIDSAVATFVNVQFEAIQNRGLDPRDYEVILCSDRDTRYTRDGMRINQRICVVQRESPAHTAKGRDVFVRFPADEAQHLASLLRIANQEDAMIHHSAVIQRAEQEALDIMRRRLNEQLIN
jgi:hypothetical protein